MIKKIVLITNFNLYHSKRRFTQKFSEALNRKGVETRIIDAEETVLDTETVGSIKKFKPDVTCSFNTLLPFPNKKFLWDLLKIPHWSILVDPSIYSVNLINSPYSVISCVDRFDCEGLAATGFQKSFFWPHGVEKELKSDNGERPYDVAFLGSCYDYENLRGYWQDTLPKKQSDVLDSAIEIVLSDNHTPLQAALVQAWNAAGLFPGQADFATLFYYLDLYTRGKDRVDLIRSIKDANVHVFGDLSQDNVVEKLGWSYYVGSQPNVTLHDSVSFEDSYAIMKQCKICLNSNPFFKNGSHERVFNSYVLGAVPLTSDNLFMREQFEVGNEILLHQNRELDLVNAQVNDLLANETKRQEMANRGRDKVLQHHTWDKRAEQVLEILPALLK